MSIQIVIVVIKVVCLNGQDSLIVILIVRAIQMIVIITQIKLAQINRPIH